MWLQANVNGMQIFWKDHHESDRKQTTWGVWGGGLDANMCHISYQRVTCNNVTLSHDRNLLLCAVFPTFNMFFTQGFSINWPFSLWLSWNSPFTCQFCLAGLHNNKIVSPFDVFGEGLIGLILPLNTCKYIICVWLSVCLTIQLLAFWVHLAELLCDALSDKKDT